jgi:hypothetical protein
MPSKILSFLALSGDQVARQCQKDQIFGGSKPPPNPHRVSTVTGTSCAIERFGEAASLQSSPRG